MPYAVPYVAILDVGHGNSTVLRNENITVIVDCGARGSGLLEFLERENITEIDSIFLSHADQDHIGGLLALLSSPKLIIHAIYLNADSSKGSTLWDGLTYELSQAQEKGAIKFEVGISRKMGIMKWDSLGLDIISPTGYLAAKGVNGKDRYGRTINSNSMSASFKILWNDRIVAYLSGDIDQISLDDILDHDIDMTSPLLVFPHHGGNSEGFDNVVFTERLCAAVGPTTVIFSIGRNTHGNPRPEVVEKVRSIIKEVRIACTQLSKNCADDLPKTNSPHLLDLFSRGKEKVECCSGTFVIKLGDEINHFPEANPHMDFIKQFASSSLCK